MVFFDDKYVDAAPISRHLPFFHSCDAFAFRSILETRTLKASTCGVFQQEKLLYLFYGRPAYKLRQMEPNRLQSFLPVCFILDEEVVSGFRRIFPFDSGAFQTGLYKDYMHPGMLIDAFQMHPDEDAIARTINYFFGTSENYFSAKPKKDIAYDPLNFEIESYYNLIKNTGISPADDRKATIEIQLAHDIILTARLLKAVIFPGSLRPSPLIEQVLVSEIGAELITYDDCGGIGSPLYYAETVRLTKDYLINKNKYDNVCSL